MRHFKKISALVGSLSVAAALAVAAPAQAQEPGAIIGGIVAGAFGAPFGWGGRQYCWYDGGWRGPGWYWCGYANRYGYGWGGPRGWERGHGGGGRGGMRGGMRGGGHGGGGHGGGGHGGGGHHH